MMEVVEVGLYTLFEALSIVFCLHYLYGEKIHFDAITAIYILVDVVWMSIMQIFHLQHSWSLVFYFMVALYCGLEFGFSFKIILINNVLYMTILSGIQATIIMIFNIFLGIKRVGELDSVFINVIMLILVIGILKKCKLNKLSEILQSNEKIIVISLILVIVSTALFLVNYKQNIAFNVLYYVVLGVSILMIVVAAIDIGKHKIRMRETETELRLHKLYEQSFQNLITDICAKQHEFDNHINAIYSQHFLYKTYEELVEAQKKYCEEIINENHYNKLLSKGNPVILGFLYGKFLEIEKRKIKVLYKISIGNLDSRVPIYKMVELLGNLINNAIEAAEEKGTKEIRVVVLEEKDKIQIEVSNESEVINYKKIQEFFKKGYSEKGRNRGYGLYNVKKICEEYNIDIICENCAEEGTNWLKFGLSISKPL